MNTIDKLMALADVYARAMCNRAEARSGLATRLACMDEDAANKALRAAIVEALDMGLPGPPVKTPGGCDHDQRFKGVFFMPPGTNGCVACAFEQELAKNKLLTDALRARQMPDSSITMLAETDLEHVHDDNGAGDVYCPVCSGHVKMRWKNGTRLEKDEEFPHNAGCPVVWARAQVAARKT